jgi:opacity protein-like surface antigen
MSNLIPVRTASVSLALLLGPALVHATGNFYLKPHVGASFLQDTDINQAGVVSAGADGDGEFDTGWAAGLAFGYRYGNGWSAELDWEYRTNDNDSIDFSDGTSFSDGDFSSNTLYLNGYYTFNSDTPGFRPYLGAGVGWVEEIDLDLESGGLETSYSSDGDIAWQVMAGVERDIADNWRLQGEIRYSSIRGVDLDAESGSGKLKDVDYDATVLSFAVVYDF